MITITDKILALTSEGTLIIFANRDEFADWAKDKRDFEVWVNPNWLLRALRRDEALIEEHYNEINKNNDNTPKNEGGFSEATINAIKAREDKWQREIAEVAK